MISTLEGGGLDFFAFEGPGWGFLTFVIESESDETSTTSFFNFAGIGFFFLVLFCCLGSSSPDDISMTSVGVDTDLLFDLVARGVVVEAEAFLRNPGWENGLACLAFSSLVRFTLRVFTFTIGAATKPGQIELEIVSVNVTLV